jgi:hypothetical protein
LLDEFYRLAFRKRLYATLDVLQADLDRFVDDYNLASYIDCQIRSWLSHIGRLQGLRNGVSL